MAAPNTRGTPDGKGGRADALALMDLTKIMRAYVGGMLDSIPGYKGLLLDKDTMRTCSTLFGRTELAEHNTVHVEKIDTDSAVEHTELHVGLRAGMCDQGPSTSMTGQAHLLPPVTWCPCAALCRLFASCALQETTLLS